MIFLKKNSVRNERFRKSVPVADFKFVTGNLTNYETSSEIEKLVGKIAVNSGEHAHGFEQMNRG